MARRVGSWSICQVMRHRPKSFIAMLHFTPGISSVGLEGSLAQFYRESIVVCDDWWTSRGLAAAIPIQSCSSYHVRSCVISAGRWIRSGRKVMHGEGRGHT